MQLKLQRDGSVPSATGGTNLTEGCCSSKALKQAQIRRLRPRASSLQGRRAINMEYSRILTEVGLKPENRGPWTAVGSTNIVEGWKLHCSSIPTEATDLLKLLVPMLRRHAVSFKVATDSAILESLNEGTFGPTQIGK